MLSRTKGSSVQHFPDTNFTMWNCDVCKFDQQTSNGDSNLRDEFRKKLDAIFEAVLLSDSSNRF